MASIENEKFDLESNEGVSSYVPSGVPFRQGVSITHVMQRTMSPRDSISIGPTRIDPSARIPVEFRTMSIHITNTEDGSADAKARRGVAGTSLAEILTHRLTFIQNSQPSSGIPFLLAKC